MTIKTICKRSILTYSACKEEKSSHKIHTRAIYSPSTYNIYNDVEFLVSVKFVTCPFLIKHFSLFPCNMCSSSKGDYKPLRVI